MVLIRLHKGFTLIELMVGIAIMAMVLASSVSLGGGWIDEARATDARSQIRLAYSKAKAFALMNSNSSVTVASVVCIANSIIYVYVGDPATCGASGFQWRADVAGGATTTFTNTSDASTFNCISLNNRGLPTTGATISNCTPTGRNVTVTRGSNSYATPLI